MALRSRVDVAVEIVDDLIKLVDEREVRKIAEEIFALEVKATERPLLSTLRRYPRKRRNQKYKRTFKLKRSWRLRMPNKLQWVIESVGVDYAKWVIGTFDARNPGSTQARIHRGRWKLALPKVQLAQEQFIERFGTQFNETFAMIAIAAIKRRNR